MTSETETEQPILLTRHAPDMRSGTIMFECEHAKVSSHVGLITPEVWQRAITSLRERLTCDCGPDAIVDVHESLTGAIAATREMLDSAGLGHEQATMLVAFLGRYECFACPTCDPTVWRRSIESDGGWRVLFGGIHGTGCPTPGVIDPPSRQPEVIDTSLRVA